MLRSAEPLVATCTPLPEAVHGAYSKLRAAGRDPVAAYGIVSLISRPSMTPPLWDTLARHDLTVSARVPILRSTNRPDPFPKLIRARTAGSVATAVDGDGVRVLGTGAGGQPTAR